MRRFASALLRLLARVFWRRIEFVGLERVPATGPVIFAVNHPNGLLDPLFLICFAPRPVSFLAKAPLFRYPIIGWFVRAFDSIPVYRKQDFPERGEELRDSAAVPPRSALHPPPSNRETFAKAREVLARGGTIAIFPEGTTHSDPSLRELKTGAARIALGAAQPQMTIIPAGIYYTAKQTFRSSALVVFGEPIDVAPQPVDANGEPPIEPVAELTRRIDEGLDAVTIQADSHNALELIGRAEDIFTADANQSLGEEFVLRRRFIEGYHYLRERDPQRLVRLQSAITQFGSELGKARLEAHELAPAFSARTLLRALVLLPLALVGLVLHYPSYRFVGFLAGKAAKDSTEMTATMKFLGALAVFPLTWIAYALLSWRMLGHAWIALAFPLLGWIALRVFEDLDDLTGRTRALLHRAAGNAGYLRLVAERERLRNEIIALADEMESGGRSRPPLP